MYVYIYIYCTYFIYTIWLFKIDMENPLQMEVLMGTSSINGPFSMAMSNYQRVYLVGGFNPSEKY